MVKSLPANAGDTRGAGLIFGVGKMPWRRAWQPAPVFFLDNSMDRGTWQAIAHRFAESDATEATWCTHMNHTVLLYLNFQVSVASLHLKILSKIF